MYISEFVSQKRVYRIYLEALIAHHTPTVMSFNGTSCVSLGLSNLSELSRCVSIQLVYIFTSYTTINIIIHTVKCYKINGYMFRSPLRPSSGQRLQIVCLQCAYNMGSHNVYIIFYIWTKITVKSLHC